MEGNTGLNFGTSISNHWLITQTFRRRFSSGQELEMMSGNNHMEKDMTLNIRLFGWIIIEA
tara:strand:- start:405 stop:587 length:183 start_codon:yes stop_codon:yes gene_type:complete